MKSRQKDTLLAFEKCDGVLLVSGERILQYLLVMAPPGRATIVVDRPLKSIADDLGLTHESFYRTLAQLAKELIIIRKKGSIAFQIPGAMSRS